MAVTWQLHRTRFPSHQRPEIRAPRTTHAPLAPPLQARQQLLLTEEQAVRCYELQQFLLLQKALAAAEGEEAQEVARKPFRLQVVAVTV